MESGFYDWASPEESEKLGRRFVRSGKKERASEKRSRNGKKGIDCMEKREGYRV